MLEDYVGRIRIAPIDRESMAADQTEHAFRPSSDCDIGIRSNLQLGQSGRSALRSAPYGPLALLPGLSHTVRMSCLGVHYALTSEEVARLKAFDDDSERLDHLQETIEEDYFANHSEFIAESDKSWDAMHRALSDGQLSYTSGPNPLRLAVIGGECLYFEDDYLMSLKTPSEVKSIVQALLLIDEADFRRRYEAIDAEAYGFPKSEQDFGYTWGWFVGVREFYQRAAAADRHVLFTADQ